MALSLCHCQRGSLYRAAHPFSHLTYPRSAIDTVVAVTAQAECHIRVRAVEELRLDDADGLPREVVRHVPHEGEDEDEDAVSGEEGSHIIIAMPHYGSDFARSLPK